MMRSGLMVILVFLFMAAAPGRTRANPAACPGTVFKHAYRVEVCVPRGWSEEVKDTIVKIKDQKVWNVSMRLEPMEGDDIVTAMKHVNGKIADLVTGEWGAPQIFGRDDPKNANRMDGAVMNGRGKRKDTGADVKVILAVLLTPLNKYMLVSVIADLKWMRQPAQHAQVKALLDSVQPSKAPQDPGH